MRETERVAREGAAREGAAREGAAREGGREIGSKERVRERARTRESESERARGRGRGVRERTSERVRSWERRNEKERKRAASPSSQSVDAREQLTLFAETFKVEHVLDDRVPDPLTPDEGRSVADSGIFALAVLLHDSVEEGDLE